MLLIAKYVRKPFHIDAVQVTAENIDEVAKWASGEVRTDTDSAGKKYIKVRVHRPLNERQTKAYAGDWVLYAGTGFKVYTTKAFKDNFELSEDSDQPTQADVAIAEEAAETSKQPAKKAAARA